MPCSRAQTHLAISSHCFSFSCCSASRSCSTLAIFVIRLLMSARVRAVSAGGDGGRSSPPSHPPLPVLRQELVTVSCSS